MDGRWFSWSSWGSCTKTCGGGSQQRQRVCEGPFFGGEHCIGDKTDIRRCNEKRCPGTTKWTNIITIYSESSVLFCDKTKLVWILYRAEPHEICGEESYGNAVWKRTPAGDTVAVPCPSDATGTEKYFVIKMNLLTYLIGLDLLYVPHGSLEHNDLLFPRVRPPPLHPGCYRLGFVGQP